MTKFKGEAFNAEYAQKLLNAVHGLGHLRARHRAETITIESGPADDPILHARVRRVGAHLWVLETADHRGSWEPTDVRTNLDSAGALGRPQAMVKQVGTPLALGALRR